MKRSPTPPMFKYVLLESLPLTANGKVDREAVPAPQQPQLKVAYVPPDTKTERQIAAVWQQVLGVEKVGVHDNFFELGGNSLLLIRAHNQVCQVLKIDFPIIDPSSNTKPGNPKKGNSS